MSQPVESVAVVGAGAMGAMYAVHFVEGGLRTSLVASGERARRLRADGLLVNGTPPCRPACSTPAPILPSRSTSCSWCSSGRSRSSSRSAGLVRLARDPHTRSE